MSESDLEYRIKNEEMVERGITALRMGHYDLIRAECFNVEEVEEVKAILQRKAPDLADKFIFTWLTFKDPVRR